MDPIILNLHLVDLHGPVTVADLQDPLFSGKPDFFLNFCLHLIPHCQRIKAHRPCLRNHLTIQRIEISQELHLLLLIKPDVQLQDSIHCDLPHLPVGIRLQFQIPVYQLHRNKRDHVLR